jgi:Ca2+-transporting ATPase
VTVPSTSFGSTPEEAVAALDVLPGEGLSEDEAHRRLEKAGLNRLVEAAPRSRWLLLADQFRSLLIAILLVAALLSLVIGDLKDALVIAVVVLVNAGLGFSQSTGPTGAWPRCGECSWRRPGSVAVG